MGKPWDDWPPAPGTYLLVLRLRAPERLRIGALGEHDCPAGAYVYCGSALGSGGVRARVRRHLEGAAALHWHIDFLLRRAGVDAVWARLETRRLECLWAAALSRSEGFTSAVPRFGASDCRCRAHLWRAGISAAGLDAVLRRLPFPPRLLWRADIPADMLRVK